MVPTGSITVMRATFLFLLFVTIKWLTLHGYAERYAQLGGFSKKRPLFACAMVYIRSDERL